MEWDFIKLGIVFCVIVLMIILKFKLRDAIIAAALTTILLYRIPILTVAKISGKSIVEKSTLLVIGSFILVTFVQRIMEGRKLLERAELALQRLSGSRRAVCIIAPVVIGFLPSMGAVNICGVIVENSIGDALDTEEKTFVTSYYRHISEAFSPTYNSIILALSIASVSTGEFVLLTLPMVAALIALGYWFYLRRVERKFAGREEEVFDRKEEWKQLTYCFWPLVASIIIVVILNVSMIFVLPFVILACIVVYRLKPEEVWKYAKTSVEVRIILNTIVLMIFKNLLTYTGVITRLPDLFEGSPLPQFLVFGLIIMFGTIISGANTMILLILPLAMEAMPNAGAGIVMFLMAVSYAAMQVSPTHICLAVVTEHFHTSFGSLVKKTAPVIGSFLVILCVYYVLLTKIGIY